MAKLEKGAKMDLFGFVVFSISLLTFLLALTYQAYGLSEKFIVYFFFIMSGITLFVFILQERKQLHPLVDLQLFKIREFIGGVIALMLNAIAWGAMLLLVSLYFQLILDLSPLEAGIRIIPFDIAFLICGIISGRLSDKYSHLPFTTSGLAFMSLSLYALSTLDAATSFLRIVVYLVILGIGCGAFSSPNTSSIMGSVPAERRGIAAALRATIFNIGFVISLNVAILVMTFTVPFSTATKIISSTNQMETSQADKKLFMKGLDNTYTWLAVINLAAIPPSVLRGRRRKAKQVEG